MVILISVLKERGHAFHGTLFEDIVEKIKKFRLIDILLTAEDDELTPTMKLKRSFVETKHGELISQMY